MRRQQLSEAQITALLDPPTDQRELVRHYTLSAADLAAIRRCRGDHNRLGHALMLCYLRYPGRLNRGLSRRGAEPTAPCGRTAGPSRVSTLWDASCRRSGRLAAAARDRDRQACASRRAGGGGVPAAPDRRPIARRARAALRPSPLSGAWRGPTPADRWALRRPTSSAGCADAAPGGNQPELARLATPDAGSGEAGRDARSDRATGPCPRSWP